MSLVIHFLPVGEELHLPLVKQSGGAPSDDGPGYSVTYRLPNGETCVERLRHEPLVFSWDDPLFVVALRSPRADGPPLIVGKKLQPWTVTGWRGLPASLRPRDY